MSPAAAIKRNRSRSQTSVGFSVGDPARNRAARRWPGPNRELDATPADAVPIPAHVRGHAFADRQVTAR